jgi:acyl-CoA hydrolase
MATRTSVERPPRGILRRGGVNARLGSAPDTRLSRGAPFVAVNTAIEIDRAGQVNVEGVQDKVVGGIGGHPDFCAGARMSRRGLSIIAVLSTFEGRSPFVEQLSRPASTPGHDVDVVVTENGHADMRGEDWPLRQRLLEDLFG